jgi:hypothetical protein
VLATASCRRELSIARQHLKIGARKEDCFGETPKPTRETRALPTASELDNSARI